MQILSIFLEQDRLVEILMYSVVNLENWNLPHRDESKAKIKYFVLC